VGMQGMERDRTHSCGSHEHGVGVFTWTKTYRFCVVMHDDGGPDEVQRGGIPILQDCQANHGLRQFGMPYGDEQYKYCWITTRVIRYSEKVS